jgi:type IV secretory pathway VirD2 relaxase
MRDASDELSLDVRSRRSYQRHERPPRPRRGRVGLRGRRQPSAGRGPRAAGVASGWGPRRQRSTVKVAYVRNGKAGAWRAHGAYLAREGAQRTGEKGLGFDATHDDVDMASTLGAWQGAGDARLWKAIVSPEQAPRLDLRAHARALVAQMEHDLGTAPEWVAIDHHDTDNSHVHVLIRGRDDRGRPLAIDSTYVQRGIRERSAELATRVLGLRSERDILTSREQAVERAQFTELDRRLLTIASDQRRVRYRGRPPRDRRRRAQRTLEMRRLDFLVTLGVAQRTATGT